MLLTLIIYVKFYAHLYFVFAVAFVDSDIYKYC